MAIDWCPFAVKRPIIQRNYTQGRGRQPVKAVVLHIVSGWMANVFDTFNDANSPHRASAHFCIGRDGTIEQYVSVNDTAHANGLRWSNDQWFCPHGNPVKPTWQDLIPKTDPNLYTVSIEHEGFPIVKWTEAMYAANNRLLWWLAEQFALAYTPHRTLIGHCEIDPVDRPHCPGPHVEYERMCVDLAAIAAAKQFHWMPINTNAALYQFALTNDLGYPQTDEFEFVYSNETYIAQVFNGGIVYVMKGDWGNVKWIRK